MRGLWEKCRRFLQSEDGPTAVEYAVMLALILVVCFAAIQSIGSPTTNSFQRVVDLGFNS
jgi:pilus assembly protein Flp/PilA